MQDYQQAVSWAAQTALRDIIGRTSLDRSAARPRADRGGAAEADRRALQPLGRDRAVGRDARRRDSRVRCRTRCRARRRRRARSRRASSSARPRWRSRTASPKAAESYHNNPTALHLRAMNMLYEGLKEKGALMLVPSSAVESMGMGGTDGRGRAAPRRARRLAAARRPSLRSSMPVRASERLRAQAVPAAVRTEREGVRPASRTRRRARIRLPPASREVRRGRRRQPAPSSSVAATGCAAPDDGGEVGVADGFLAVGVFDHRA